VQSNDYLSFLLCLAIYNTFLSLKLKPYLIWDPVFNWQSHSLKHVRDTLKIYFEITGKQESNLINRKRKGPDKVIQRERETGS
jgi:hypothetical protein